MHIRTSQLAASRQIDTIQWYQYNDGNDDDDLDTMSHIAIGLDTRLMTTVKLATVVDNWFVL